jgi:hypothetical protein
MTLSNRDLAASPALEQEIGSAQTNGVVVPENGNGDHGIAEIPEIAYVQEEFGAWLKYLLERNGIEIDAAQSRAIDIVVAQFADRCYKLLDEQLFPNAINRYAERDLKEFYVSKIREQLTSDKASAAVILDQAIYHMVRQELGKDHPNQIVELSMGRPHANLYTSAAGGKVSRVGYPSLEEQVRQIKEQIGDRKAFLVDDTTVEGGTFNTATELLKQGGIQMADLEKHLVYFLTLREETGMKRKSPPYTRSVKMTNSRGSIELRECSVFGGAQEATSADNSRAVVIPAFPPFSDGTALRMAKNGVSILNIAEAASELNQLNKEFAEDLGGILGKGPKGITLGTFNLVPADPAEQRESAPNDPTEMIGQGRAFMRHAMAKILGKELPANESLEKYLASVPLVDYLQIAKEHTERQPKPAINTVCVDTDGTIAEMMPVDPELREIGGPMLFRETQLGFHVYQRAARGVRKLLRTNQLATVSKLGSENIEQVLQLFYRWKLDAEAEQQYGEEAKERIRQIFIEGYGKGRGLVEAERFIDSMPTRYHAIRHMTWDLPLDEIYTKNAEAQQFAMNVQRRGGKLVFVTASPRIHAVKLLTSLGIMQNPGPDHFELYTVEDLYDPETVPRRRNPHPNQMFVEREKSVILQQLHENTGVEKGKIAMGGDVYRTEVQPALFNGFPARIVRNPAQLKQYAMGIQLPGDDAIKQEDLYHEFQQ